MISLTGRKNWSRPAAAAFTFIELIIVATIIAVLMAISSPLFRETFRDLELQDAAYNVSKLIRYAQQRAIVGESIYGLIFDFDGGSYSLKMEVEEKVVKEVTSEDGDTVETTELVKSWQDVTGRFQAAIHLPEGVDLRGTSDKIRFLPNGRCSKETIYVSNRKNKTIQIKTNGRAGHVEVSEHEEK
ncbi:MAG: prepilin-type N-terminal cleavage/methylation domain-containing protein [Candidatus Omnitrophica bacterium]|nr:prepilin-type N-terminal cleavage/methylation domain-containing protein [Candidatus Omnitrophota bacterium]